MLLRYSRDAVGCGGPVQLSPFRGCLSGSSEPGWGSVELLRTSGGRVFCMIARSNPGLGLALPFWVFHVWIFSGSPSGSGWGVLCFRHACDVVLRDLPCSSVGGLHCTGPANARQIAMGEGYSLWGRSCFPGPLGATHRRRCVPFILPQVVA